MTRDTSLISWMEVQERLPRRRRAAYVDLVKNGPATATELEHRIGDVHAHKRLSELERIGLAAAGRSRACKHTGKTAIEWLACEGPVMPLPRKQTRKELEAEIARLQLENTTLRAKVIGMETKVETIKRDGFFPKVQLELI